MSTAITIALAGLVGALLASIWYHRKTIDLLKGSIGELSKASKALAEKRVKEAETQAVKNIEAADTEFENAFSNSDFVDADERR